MPYGYRQGEEMAIQCLTAKGFDVIDRRDSPEYWKKDIDITAKKGILQQDIEVKWDSKIYNSNAFFFELIADIEQDQQGWAAYTQSDYIFYGDSKSKVFYVFRTKDMQEFIEQHSAEYETRKATDYNKDGTIRKQSLGAIVPIGLFRKAVKVQEIDIEQRLQSSGF